LLKILFIIEKFQIFMKILNLKILHEENIEANPDLNTAIWRT